MPKKSLVLLHSGFEELEAITPIDLLRRAGIAVITASVDGKVTVTSKGGISIQADSKLEAEKDTLFDAIILPGGPGIFNIRNNIEIESLILRHYNESKCIACICASPLIPLDLGLNQSHTMTCHPSVAHEFKKLDSKNVVLDANIITSKGAGTALEFASTIIQYLSGSEVAQKVSESICL